MSLSRITPKFLTDLTGSKNLPEMEIEDEDNLEHCIEHQFTALYRAPIFINSVLDGFRYRQLFVNQV